MTPTNAAGPEGGPTVEALVQQREQLRAWIAKLDEVRTEAPSRVAQRVRADYEDRLRRVTEELGAHREEIERDLEALRAELQAAEERRTQAADALDETQLRHLIGELDEGAWDEARPRLEAALADADDALARNRGEVERLSALAGEIAEPAPEPEPQSFAPEPAAEPEPADEPEPFYAPVAQEALAVEDAPLFAEPAVAETDAAPAAEAEPAPAAEPASGSAPDEDLAAWLNQVEAEAGLIESSVEPAPPAPPAEEARPAAAADDWDPFANEFGGAPASPHTQPGDAADELPWLDAIDGAGGAGWSQPAEEPANELAFLDDLEGRGAGASGGTIGGATPPPAAPAADLAADDLAFLEELDRAISGGAGKGTPPPAAAPAPAPAIDLIGGSGEGGTLEPRKKGESLLCKECGAINEPQAWYCEICGSEL
jgi:Skp family chaperone for outer membrane proteins